MLLHLPDEAPRAALPLAQLLGYASDTGTTGSSRHVLLTEDENQAGLAILVDQISDARSVIIKRLGPHVALNPGVRGATILGDGSVAIVIDLAQLLARRSQTEATAFANPVRSPAQQIPSVLIVDDSLSVRRSLEQVIGDAGFRVATARDGLEAVERVRSQRPDLMVIDLEMPRMNGLELTSYIRNEDSTRGIPIIMITSRTTERHRDLARAAGVDTILSKPYSEEGLLALIADKLARGRQAA
jgi:chemosensory pili system protein ChpA (sensor histidine kinase/response regulator)